MNLFTGNTTIVLIFLLIAVGNSEGTPDPVLNKICTGSCTGGVASVTVWRDSTGKTAYYELSGDLRSCSHPPLILYDSHGREVLAIPNQPVDPNKKEMVESLDKVHQKRKELLNGHTPSKPVFCSQLARE